MRTEPNPSAKILFKMTYDNDSGVINNNSHLYLRDTGRGFYDGFSSEFSAATSPDSNVRSEELQKLYPI